MSAFRPFIIFLALPFIFSCSQKKERNADTIFYGGDILTMEDLHPTAEAVAVLGGKIIFIGKKEEALHYKTSTTEVIDLQGKTLLPGFIDPHTHIIPTALTLKGFQLDPFTYKTGGEVLTALKEKVKEGPLLAFRYDPSLMKEPIDLNFKTLNSISQTTPILIINTSGHIAYGNDAAFRAANITSATRNPQGASFERDKNNNLTGVAFELPAVALLLESFLQMKKLDFETLTKDAISYYARQGYTTLTDLALGLPMPTPLESLEILRKVAHDKEAPVRIQGYLIYPLLQKFAALEKRNDPSFKVLGIKIWADGSLQGHTGALTEPYTDLPKSRGTLNYPAQTLTEMVKQVHEKGIQVAIHANGDAAIQNSLNAFEQALHTFPATDPRFRVEHATILDRGALIKMKNVKATPSFTVLHIYNWGEVLKDKILGEARANDIDPARSAKELGLKFSINEDSLSEVGPLFLIQVVVTRQMRDGQVLSPDETISVNEALKAMTIYPAWQSFRDKEIGSIATGKYADFVILAKNPKKVNPTEIGSIPVVETWLEGRRVLQETSH
jgi:predicted amidohydrolase YtcJ